MKYFDHYVKRLRESFAANPEGKHLLALLDPLESFPSEQRFIMVQEIERLVRDTDPSQIDWIQAKGFIEKAAQDSKNAEEFVQVLRKHAHPHEDPPA